MTEDGGLRWRKVEGFPFTNKPENVYVADIEGCFSKDSRIKSRSAAHPCGGPAHRAIGVPLPQALQTAFSNVEHDRGESSGSAALAARRAGYPLPEQIDRKMSRNV